MPLNYPGTVQKSYYNRGLSFARGTSIDAYLSEEDKEVLYEKWQQGWPEPISLRGGLRDITCEMVLEAPEKEFIKVFGKKIAERILSVAKMNAGR